MLRAFLSHSSKDKSEYVDIVADRLGKSRVVYDEWTFEAGLKTADEILKTLGKSDIFVIFLSNHAVDSEWVKGELAEAYERLGVDRVQQIYPLIIDKDLHHSDPRIPEWMRTEYNLRYVSRPSVAARRIVEQLRILSWQLHPKLYERNRLFVGRNNLLAAFEERVDSLDESVPVCFIASGLKGVGRRTLLKKCLVKADLIEESYEPASIVLFDTDSIEDFLLKIYDLGFSAEMDLTNLLSTPVSRKLDMARTLVRDIQEAEEILLIVDDGCIVTRDGIITQWFDSLVTDLASTERPTFAIVSTYRTWRKTLRHTTSIFRLEVPELQAKERNGLLKRYAEMRGLDLRLDDLRFFAGLLTGLPEQAFYTVHLIEEIGLTKAKSESSLIVEFNTNRVIKLVRRYEERPNALEFLAFLAQFDFISYNFIFEIVGLDDSYAHLLDEFFTSAIVEFIGATREYVRVNDAIRDYVLRNYNLSDRYREKLRLHLERFLRDYRPEDSDVSDLLFTMRAALLTNQPIDPRYLIPSHFLKSMKELYDYQRHDEVIELADRVLVNADYMDAAIEQQIRYNLCMSLARLRSGRFVSEVQKISGPEHKFLFGFYYRLVGNYAKALDSLNGALNERANFPRARNELARIYLYLEDFERARQLAKRAYEDNRTNSYAIKTYFDVVVRLPRSEENKAILLTLLAEFAKLGHDKAVEMFLNAQALYLAFYSEDYRGATELARQARDAAPKNAVTQPSITRFLIAAHFCDTAEMDRVLRKLDSQGYGEGSDFRARYVQMRSVWMAMSGDVNGAREYATRWLKSTYPADALERLKLRLQEEALRCTGKPGSPN